MTALRQVVSDGSPSSTTNTAKGHVVTAVELLIALPALALVVSGHLALLLAWESVASVYLAVGAANIRCRSYDRREPWGGRTS